MPDDRDPAPPAARPDEAEGQLDQLNQLSVSLASNRDPTVLTQSIIDTATRLTGAAYGSFFERIATGEVDRPDRCIWRASRAPRATPSCASVCPARPPCSPDIHAETVIRSDDVMSDPRYGSMGGMPNGHLPVRSYLAAAVTSRNGEVLGALLFGHPEPGRSARARSASSSASRPRPRSRSRTRGCSSPSRPRSSSAASRKRALRGRTRASAPPSRPSRASCGPTMPMAAWKASSPPGGL